jgi:hypothetical protein
MSGITTPANTNASMYTELINSAIYQNKDTYSLKNQVLTYFKDSLKNINFYIIYEILLLPYTMFSLLELRVFSYHYKYKTSNVSRVILATAVIYFIYLLLITILLAWLFGLSLIYEYILIFLAIYSIFYIINKEGARSNLKGIDRIIEEIDKGIEKVIEKKENVHKERIKVESLLAVKDALIKFRETKGKSIKSIIASYFVLTKFDFISVVKSDKKLLKCLEAETNQVLNFIVSSK